MAKLQGYNQLQTHLPAAIRRGPGGAALVLLCLCGLTPALRGAEPAFEALLLCKDRSLMLPVLHEGNGELSLDFHDCNSRNGAIVVERQRMSPRIEGWNYRLAENPGRGEYRYLRFSWKKRGGGGVLFELANAGAWSSGPQNPRGRYAAGLNNTGRAAISIADSAPSDWTVVTRDLWKDLGPWKITGLRLTSIGGEAALFDDIVLSPTLEGLEAYAPRSGPAAAGEGVRIGSAWSDPRNPVGERFEGRRLDLWSLRKPARPALPPVKQSAWPRGAVDQFILADLEARGLTPSAPADRRTLIRRLSFDLLGLPPTPEEIRQFESDPSSDAYERLVDRMLASSHYGERWGRHWLDVARYADTNGFERDEFRPTMWRYRDYVIESLNVDKPYDQFIREQLAGDEWIGGTDVQQQVATGYLRCGPFDTTKDGLFDSPAEGRDQLMVDLVNATGAAFLGQTVSCCRCHDHKTEPLLQADHYRLRAFFAAVQFNDVILDSPEKQAEISAHNAALEAAITPLNLQRRKIRNGGAARVAAQLQATFPADIQQSLAIPEAQRDQSTQQKLDPYLKKLKIPEEEALKVLTADEKPRYDELVKQIAALTKQRPAFTTAPGIRDSADTVSATHILEQGDFTKPQETVDPGPPSLFDPNTASINPDRTATTGRRSALAAWIASEENPWTARVMVNRIWQHHFSRGLVATPDNFGYSGARPTHPQLLDWLAVEFMAHGWSTKHIHRLLLLSSTYRQTSAIDERSSIDPDNRYYWRQNVRRLDAESLRDALLAISGKLLPYNAGPPLWPEVPADVMRGQPSIFEQTDRLQGYYTDPVEKTDVRTVFLARKRGIPLPFLQAFNLPDASCTCGRREVTTVAPQALMLLNNSLVVRMSEALAQRLERTAADDVVRQLDLAISLAFGRTSEPDERQLLSEQFARLKQLHADRLSTTGTPRGEGKNGETAQHAALVDICRAIFNTNEFVYID